MAFWNKRRKQADAPPTQTEKTVSPPAPASAPAGPRPERLLSYQVANLQGVGTRARQEDSFAFINAVDVLEMKRSGLLAVVADGMGGMRDGKVASETAISSLRTWFQSLDRAGDIPSQMETGLRDANRVVYQTLGGDGGSTAVVCLLYQETLYFASTGDSGLYLLRDGQLLRLNREHNVKHRSYLETILAGSMDPVPAREEEEAPALTSFLGMEELAEVDLLRRPMKLHDGDLLLICSDGVDGVLSRETILDCLSRSTPGEMCAALDQAVIQENKRFQDNYTALVLRCGY